MKRKLTLLLTAFLLLTGMVSWGQECYLTSINLSEQGYENGQSLDGVDITVNNDVTLTFYKGTSNNEPKYYNTGTAVRCYGGNYFTVTTLSGSISAVTLTFGSGDGSNEITTDVGSFDSPTWTGNDATVNFTIGGTSGHRRIQALEILYCSSGTPQPTVASPTFSPEGGTYDEGQTVTISCETAGATIHYTLDGTNPTENSDIYISALTINETTTVKAKAWKEGYNASAIASATYTIIEPSTLITITEARALANNEYALVQGVVTFIDGRNVYIQDETAGIDLFLNNNTVPSDLTLGDLVQAYGKRATYNGLAELSSIDGNDAEQFSILSSGNTLPLAVKTIAEILEGGADALQCTRVKVEGATIGAINTNGNTPLTQDGASINIYKVPALTGIEEGDVVDVVSVIGYFNTPQLRVALASDVVLSDGPTPPPTPTEDYIRISDLSQLVAGCQVVFAARFDENATDYYAMSNTSSGKPNGVLFTSATSDSYEILPDSIVEDESSFYWTVGVTDNGYTFTNVLGELIGYSSSTNFATGGDNTEWAIELSTAGDEAMVPNYIGFLVTNVNNDVRHFALNNNHNFGAYSTNNINNSNYNFYLDLFVKTEGIIPPTPTVATPTFTPEAGTYNDSIEVTINCATEGATIYFTTDDSDPTEDPNLQYTGTISISQTTTVKAFATKDGYLNSSTAEATYTISDAPSLITIAEARALDNNEYALVQGVVTFIDGRNVYIQDETAGIDLFLNNNTVPSNLTLGDLVQAYGKRATYNGLAELSSIDGNDAEQFSILSSGNTLPLAVKTIAEILEGGADALQCTRVKVEGATIGAINTNGNTPLTQDGSSINIYKVPALTGIEEGDVVDVVSVIGYFNTPQLRVAFASDVVLSDGPTPPPTPTEDYIRISDLSQLVAGCQVVFAARFDENATDYYAMSNTSSGKPNGVLFTSATSDSYEILPDSIVENESSFYWTVGVTDNGYTFTNVLGELIGYSSSTNFNTGGDNTEWSIEAGTASDESMVPNYSGFLVTNVNNDVRHFALNSNHNFGAYHSNNFNNNGYNFYLDLFVKAEGGDPPTPTVATPTFTPAAGTYYEVQNVTITCATDGATIYYSTVAENGPWTAYTEAITVDENMTIWAYAEKEGYNDSPVISATYIIQLGVVTIISQDWEGEMNGWTFVTVEGNKPWNVSQYQGNHYAYANGYSGGANEQWCISPAFNINDYENVVLSFRNAKNFNGPDLELKYSTNYDGVDPTTANWWTFDFNMSPGSYTWVESGYIPISIYPQPAHDCYIAFKYTSTETEAAAWEVDDIVLTGSTSVPNLTVTPSSLSGFTHVVGEGPSASQYFTLSGVNIGPAPGGGSTGSVIIQSSENEFEVSLDNETFSWQVYIDGINGTLPPTPVYVRMNGATVGQHTATITIHASSSDQATVALSGTVTEPPVPGDDYVRISDVSELVDGNRVIFAARFDENAADYYAMSNIASGKPEGVLFSSTMSGNDEILPYIIFNVQDNFYWTVNITADGYTFTNANGEMIGYTSSTNFSPNGDNTAWSIEIGTSGETSMVPNYTGFVITNVNNGVRAFALNSNHNFGPYHTQNMNSESYNFFLDIFMQGEGGTPTVAVPIFSPVGGTYYEAQEVTISCTTDGATIYYSTASENGPWSAYQNAITVDENMTIWAYAEKEGYNNSPVVNAEYIIQDDIVVIFNQDWENGWQDWTEYCEMGDSLWHIGSYGGNHYAYANGYTHPASIDWLISPAFDLDNYSDVVLTFRTARNYNGPNLEVYFSNDYDGQNPDAANWQQLECELSQGGWNWVESGDISLNEFNGTNCYIGFKYISDEDAAGWEVDDIKLSSGSATPIPTLIATPNYLDGFSYVVGHGPSESQSYVLSGVNLEDEGVITIVSCSYYEISLDDETFTEVLQFPCTDLPLPIYVRMMEGLEPHTYDQMYIANEYSDDNNNYAATVVNVSGVVHYENEPMMSAWMPLYIQGNNGSNNNRVPVAVHVLFTNLYPNTTYHYTNQFVDENDGPETAGAGNVIYVSEEGFYRSTNPSLATSGGYGEFTTDGEGLAGVWLMNEPTANARFTPGNHVYMRVRLNGGGDGTTPFYYFTSEDYATVLNFGTENDENSGSAFYVKSNEAPMTFAMLFATDMDVRPVYSTSVETTGVDYSSINQYADFYKEFVAGNDGWFGGILPNVNEDGIKYITTWDMAGFIQNQYLSEDGHWNPEANTVNPTNGLDELIYIDLTEDGVEEDIAANVKIWNTDHEFVIENGDNAHYSMTVYNILGQPMMMKQINAGSTERISHSLASGVYVINLQNNQSNVSVKIIVR